MCFEGNSSHCDHLLCLYELCIHSSILHCEFSDSFYKLRGLSHLFAASSISINSCLSLPLSWDPTIAQYTNLFSATWIDLSCLCSLILFQITKQGYPSALYQPQLNWVHILEIPSNWHFLFPTITLMGSLCRFIHILPLMDFNSITSHIHECLSIARVKTRIRPQSLQARGETLKATVHVIYHIALS